MVMEEKENVEKHLTSEEDEKLHEAYVNALGEILENDDDDARDNLADYMDELKEESEALVAKSGDFKRLPSNG